MAKQISISLEDKHIRIVRRYGKQIGVAQFSTALQALIHKFAQLNELAMAPESPEQAESQAAEPAAA